MTDFTRITALDDPARPWRAIYQAGDIFVKVYAKRQSHPFGVVGWTFSGSLCDANGQALIAANGARQILGARQNHEVTVHSDSEADITALKEEGARIVINRVVFAARHADAA